MSIEGPVTISLTVDVEGEWFELPGEQGSFDVNKLLKALQNLEILIDQLEYKIETKIPVTWFIRCDDSVAEITGKVSGLLFALDDFILRRTAKLDEFGLHPHLYRFDKGNWISETDPNMQKEQIERAAIGWKSYFGSMPKLSRIGEAVMNNCIANILSELSIEIDSTALSGRKRFDNGFQFDWTGAPYSSYIPSKKDYRRSAIDREPAHSFVEIPFTMLPIIGALDESPIMRYCNLAFKPEVIQKAIREIYQPENIVAVVHPHELLSSNRQHALIAYQPKSLEKNIENLSDTFGDLNFTLLSSFAHNVKK